MEKGRLSREVDERNTGCVSEAFIQGLANDCFKSRVKKYIVSHEIRSFAYMTEAEEKALALSRWLVTINGSLQTMTTGNLARSRQRFAAVAVRSCANATDLSLLVRVGTGILTQ